MRLQGSPELEIEGRPALIRLFDLKAEDERREIIRVHPELQMSPTVELLADQVVKLLRVDLQQAEELATTAVWLAEELDDDYCRGRGYRAAANVAHLKGEYEAACRERYSGFK